MPGKLDIEVMFRKVLSNVEWGFSGFLFYISVVFTFSPSSSVVHGSREDTKCRYEKQCSVRSFRYMFLQLFHQVLNFSYHGPY